MTAYERPSFSVAQSGRSPDACGHGWRTQAGACVFCGATWLDRILALTITQPSGLTIDPPTPPEA